MATASKWIQPLSFAARVIDFRHNKENPSMSKLIFKTMAVLAAAAAFMFAGATRNTFAADAAPSAAAAPAEEPGTKSFTLVSVEVDGTKFWLPSAIAVEQGDKVKLTLINNVPGASNQHGFTIPAYNITEVVTRGTPKTITFVADKAGPFPYSCQLHPAHIGGSLIVEPKK
jgi:nitrosocyanin